MKAIAIYSLLLLVLSTCLARPAIQGERPILNALLNALNKDHQAISDFIAKYGNPDRPVADQTAKLQGLADQGAPFTYVKDGPESAGSVGAIVTDKNGMTLLFSVMYKGDPSSPRFASLRVQPYDENAPPVKDYSGWKDLDSLTRDVCTTCRCPAMAVAVLRAGDLKESVYGVRELGKGDSASIGDVWSIGSIGKPICSTVIARLIEMGKLSWDTTLGDALGDLPMKPGYRNATLEQIMEHRGGVPQYLSFTDKMVDHLVGNAKTPRDMRLNCARDILSKDPIGKPGEKFAYSNAGYELLSVIAERTMKKPYEDLVKELVFSPLGLHHSYTAADSLPSGRPHGHVTGPSGLREEDFGGPMEYLFAGAGGGLYMSAADLAKFGEAHLQGLRGKDGLLKASSVERLHRALPADGIDYACGWGVEDHPGVERLHGHNGSNGTFRAQLCIFPKAGLVVAAFVNCGGESEPAPGLQAALAIAERFARN